MKTNIFISAARNFKNNKSYTVLNLVGLTVGMACFILIFLWVKDEYSFDRFHTNIDEIYRIEEDQFYNGQKYHVNVTPNVMAESFKETFPEITGASNFAGLGRSKLTYGEKTFFEWRVHAVSSDFLSMFSFPLIAGDNQNALNDKYAVVLTESNAIKIFGDDDPIGKTIVMGKDQRLTVTGVLKDVPRTSSIQLGYLVSIELYKELRGWDQGWGNNNIEAYVQLSKNSSLFEMEHKINDEYQKHHETTTELLLAPYKKMHLHSYWGFREGLLGIHYVRIFTIVAFLIIIIASINFMNLSTALAIKKSKDIGIKKTNGASRAHIAFLFLSEAILFSFTALLISGIIALVILPGFNNITGKDMEFASLVTTNNIAIIVAINLLVGLLAGLYPSLALSSFKPIEVLKGGLSKGKNMPMNKALVVFQFVISIFLIVGTVTAFRQTKFMKEMDVGFDRENVLFINMSGNLHQKFDALKSELEGHTGIKAISGGQNLPYDINGNSSGVHWNGQADNEEILINFKSINYNYLTTLGIDLVEGRDANKEYQSDAASGTIINKAFKDLMGEGPVVGKTITRWGTKYKIIGVTDDFCFSTLHTKVAPLMMTIVPDHSTFMYVRVDPERKDETVAFIRNKWETVVGKTNLGMNFIYQRYADSYENEERTTQLIGYFAIVSILIACMGLFGLSIYMIQNRIKEIGVRKVNGAKIRELLSLLNKDITLWILLAFVIACPVSHLFVDRWLQKFAYHTELNWWVMILAGSTALLISLITVSWQSWRAANRNPVESLRYE
ncbi:ABC transporter permease [Bacteroidales bacterium]|nr:ABC transporter permease [Bacteroidales bacterium]